VGLVAVAGPTRAQEPTGPRPTSGEPGGDVTAGERVFRADCAMCHGPDAAGMMGMHPSLRGAVERLSQEGVEVTIRKGRNTMPPMPAFEGRLSEQAIADVVAYIASLPPGPRNFGSGPDGGDGMGGMMGGGDTRGTRDGSVANWVFVAVLVALGLAVGAMVVLVFRQRRRAAAEVENARSVLDRRYAAGELTRDDYIERRRDLEA
jgi:mono/diheme cytochrome c family protein